MKNSNNNIEIRIIYKYSCLYYVSFGWNEICVFARRLSEAQLSFKQEVCGLAIFPE